MMANPLVVHGIFKQKTLAVNWTLAGHQIRTFYIKVLIDDSLLVALRIVSIIASLRNHETRRVNSPR
jgi:hypothetical protein